MKERKLTRLLTDSLSRREGRPPRPQTDASLTAWEGALSILSNMRSSPDRESWFYPQNSGREV